MAIILSCLKQWVRPSCETIGRAIVWNRTVGRTIMWNSGLCHHVKQWTGPSCETMDRTILWNSGQGHRVKQWAEPLCETVDRAIVVMITWHLPIQSMSITPTKVVS